METCNSAQLYALLDAVVERMNADRGNYLTYRVQLFTGQSPDLKEAQQRVLRAGKG